MKTFIKFIIISTLSLIIFFQNSFSSEKIKIGLIVPTSGKDSELGKSIIKSIRLAINKIDDERIEIIPKDTKSNPINSLKVSKELYDQGVRIIIGPVFNESTKYLDELKEITFISLTNKIYGNPPNVISAGVNAISQINTINKFKKMKNLERSVILIPKTDYKNEIDLAINKTNIKLKDKFYYDADPTLLTAQIEKLTRYPQRKKKLEDEIKRLEDSFIKNKEKKIEALKKKDTLGGINFDSVIIADFDESLKSVSTSLLYTDVLPKNKYFITLNQWFDESLLKETDIQPLYYPSINKENFDSYKIKYYNAFNEDPTHLSLLSYDLIGLVYYLSMNSKIENLNKIFKKKNSFKGKIGIFDIKNNKINHRLNFYKIEDQKLIEIF